MAADLLNDWFVTKQFPDRSIPSGIARRGLVTEMLYGSVRMRRQLDWLMDQMVSRQTDDAARALLHIGLYQIFHMQQVPEYAAVSETVDAARALCSDPTARFVNAILRRTLRERETLDAALAKQSPGVRFSHPDTLVERWISTYGPVRAERLMGINNTPAPLTIIPNRLVTDMASTVAALTAAGIENHPHPLTPERAIVLAPGTSVDAIPGFKEGVVTIQDAATLGATDLLAAQPGELIIDACAAPGGKSVQLGQDSLNQASIVALDLHDDRLALLEQTTTRLGVKVELRKGNATDAASLLAATDGRAPDAILLDVPCSNTGVLRRRPDARWRFRERRIIQLQKVQRAMLDAAAAVLAPGGRIIYSTCSIEPDENGRLVAAWCRDNPTFKIVGSHPELPALGAQDGAFACRIEHIPAGETAE
jgi:16S rRNA (cytosine967-C5)-methyltransferase